MSYKVYPTPDFKRFFKKLLKKYPSLKSELQLLVEKLSEYPETDIPLGYGIYKIRLAIRSKGKGKSGGARVITFIVYKENEVYLVHIYDKNQLENITKEQIYELLLQTWINNPKYEELSNINSKIYYQDGNQIISDERKVARNELISLQYKPEKHSVNTVNKNDFIVAFLVNELFMIIYNSVDEKFTVFNIITENKIEYNIDAMTILSIYPIHKHGELELPFSDKGFTVNSANRYEAKSSETIIENHFR
ncbi:MAG: hypothetical protein EA412_00015 [Chitinophagaceae bacterium]|nr:MAG: hypothetical protein EA412_00015 [Chitinophagaceae bacterium]